VSDTVQNHSPDQIDEVLSEAIEATRPVDFAAASTAALVGNVLSFSDQTVRTLNAELPGIRFRRYSSPDELCGEDRAPCLIVLDHAAADDLVELVGRLHGRFEGSMVAVAYKTLGAAPVLADRAVIDAIKPPISILPMNVSLDAWLSVVRLLLCGEHYIPFEVINAWQSRSCDDLGSCDDFGQAADRPANGGPDEPQTPLTPREMQVLPLLAEGKQNKAIAGVLGLSEHTVKLHTHNIFVKLKVNNRTCAADWYRSRYRPARGGRGGWHDSATGT
jgi:DNA-binding CsgD family transcriptional regulator